MSIDGNDIQHLLDEVDLPGPKIDLGEVVHDGQRIRRGRRIAEVVGGTALAGLLVAAVGVWLAVPSAGPRTTAPSADGSTTAPAPDGTTKPAIAATLAPTAPPPQNCSVTALALPHGVKDFNTQAIDPTGRYVVGYANSDTTYSTMFWDNGTPQAMHVSGKPSVEAVNAQGVAVGSTFTKTGFHDEKVFRWAKGNATILSYPMSGQWHPYSIYINDKGDIVANAEPSQHTGGDGAVTVLWKAGTTTGVRLPISSGSEVFGITDSGLIAGTLDLSDKSDAKHRGAVWDLTGRLLRTLPFGSYLSNVSPTGDLAEVRPLSTGPNDPQSEIEWNLRTGEVTNLDPAIGDVLAVNAKGWVLTSSFEVYKGNHAFQLPPLKAGDKAYSASIGITLADNGTVVGESGPVPAGAVLTPVEWHC